MRLVIIKNSRIKKYSADKEMLYKAGRPCALIIRLKYKGQNYSFAVPLRSNIHRSAPKDEYFPLPPRASTRAGNHHGIHYIKMFPVLKSDLVRYRTEGNAHAALVKSIIDKNEKTIISDCQKYLDSVEKGNKAKYGTDIDFLLSLL